MKRILSRAFAAALVLAVPGGSGSVAVANAFAEETVAIAFNPPVGERMRYRISKSAGTGASQPALDFDARFTRSGDDYLLTVTYVLPPEVGAAAGEFAAILLQPLALRLNSSGALIAIEDEAAYWAALDGAVEELIRRAGAGPEFGSAMRGTYRDMRNLPDEVRLNLLGQNVLPLVAMSGTELTRGSTVRSPIISESIGGPVSAELSLTLDSLEGGVARISSTSAVPPQEIERAGRELMGRFAASNPEQGAEALRDMRVTDVRQNERFEVSTATGVTRRYELVREVEVEVRGQRTRHLTTTRIERVR